MQKRSKPPGRLPRAKASFAASPRGPLSPPPRRSLTRPRPARSFSPCCPTLPSAIFRRPSSRESPRAAIRSPKVSAADSRAAQRPMDARRFAALPDPFPMWRGGILHGARIAYEAWGELNPARDNALLLFTGLSPPAHAASSAADQSEGWWQGMVGPGLAIDTNRFFVLCVNSLGSCFGSTGPASLNPATRAPYRLDFPDLSIEDIARAGFETLRSLGIERAEAVIGPSL